jgi:uncharacterized damage-inducible protein DinB
VDAIANYRRLVAYDGWANGEALRSLREAGAPPARARQFLAHVIAAQHLWLDRLDQTRQRMAVWPDLTLEQCASELDALVGRWHKLLSGLDEAGLAREVLYTNTKGEKYRSRVGDIVEHVLLHSAYHRAQVALDLRAAGHTPAYTDFIHAVRQGFVA